MEYAAIVAIVERGKANGIVQKVAAAGAHGATIAYGRGSGEQVFSFFKSLQVETSKEIILIISPNDKLDALYELVVEAARVREKGRGIAFTLPICNVAGLSGENGEKNG